MILGIIQARVASTRFLGKVLKRIQGKTLLEHMVLRVKKSKKIHRLIIATSIKEENDVIVDICKKINIDCFRGSEDDVLDRFYQCAINERPIPKFIVRLTADCPLHDAEIVDFVIDSFLKSNVDYASNNLEASYPYGLDTEIFTLNALKITWKKACLPSQREHVTPFIKQNSTFFGKKLFQAFSIKSDIDYSKHRWVLDYPEDYEFVKSVFSELYPSNPYFSYRDVLDLLREKPDLEKINSHLKRGEGYLLSLKKDETFLKGISGIQ